MKSVPIDRLRDDKITGKMPIVKKNMQGINGIELKPSEYNRILQMGRSKAPKLESFAASEGEYSTEKEVEEHIIKPLLKQLGYSDRDYVQQLYLEIGNHNHALIPDLSCSHRSSDSAKVLLPLLKPNAQLHRRWN